MIPDQIVDFNLNPQPHATFDGSDGFVDAVAPLALAHEAPEDFEAAPQSEPVQVIDSVPVPDAPALVEAMRLRNEGYYPVGLYPAGVPRGKQTTSGKEPIGKKWGIYRWGEKRLRGAFRYKPSAGVGICFGHNRGPGRRSLIDVETDGEDGVVALRELFGGSLPETLGWSSARGNHCLFVLDDVGYWRLHSTIAKFGQELKGHSRGVWHMPGAPGLEFRIGGYKPDGTPKQVQSACPPTPGTDGKPRQWNHHTHPISWPDSATQKLRALSREARGISEEEDPDPEPGGDPPFSHARMTKEARRIRVRSGGWRSEEPDSAIRSPEHLEARIGQAIERWVPSEDQKRHKCLLGVTADIAHILPEVAADETRPYFETWHSRSLPFMEETNIEFNWGEWVRCLQGAKQGGFIVPRAMERARTLPGRFVENDEQNAMARLFQAMAIERNDRTFYLGYDDIARFVGWPNAGSVRWARKQLVKAGLVKVVAEGEKGIGRKEDGTPRQATVWKWLGPLEPGNG